MSLIVKNISKTFILPGKNISVLSDVSFEVDDGQFCALIGPSGCGKSTLLRIMMGLDTESTGEVLYKGEKLIAGVSEVSMIFQHFALFPWLTVFENIEFGLKMKGVEVKKRKRVVEELMVEVGLESFSDKHPRQLSGGMKQRVGIARALSTSPKLLFMDEPFSALDAFTAETLRKELLEICKRREMTVVMVTHLVEEAVEMADKIVVFSPRPGKIEKILENKLDRPRNKRSSEFFKEVDSLTELVKI